MVCIFCIAVIAMVGAAITQAVIDSMAGALDDVAEGDVKVAADTSTMARFELEIEVPGSSAESTPVVVTVYKQQGRARIQLMSHDLTREQIREIQRRIAAALEAEIVDETDERDEHDVREVAEHQHEHDHEGSPDDGWQTGDEREREEVPERDVEPRR